MNNDKYITLIDAVKLFYPGAKEVKQITHYEFELTFDDGKYILEYIEPIGHGFVFTQKITTYAVRGTLYTVAIKGEHTNKVKISTDCNGYKIEPLQYQCIHTTQSIPY